MGFGIKDVFSGYTDPVGTATGSSVMDFIPGIGDARAAERANKENARAAANQMAFQESMSNTSYQRAMADMKAAGLNPMLAFSQGGASVPAGASYTAQSASKSKLGEFAMNAATGINMARNQNALAQNTLQDSVSNRDVQASQSAKNIAETQNIQADTALKKKSIPAAELEGELSKKGGEFIRNIIDRISNSAKQSSTVPPPQQLDRSKDKEEISKFRMEKALKEMRQRQLKGY